MLPGGVGGGRKGTKQNKKTTTTKQQKKTTMLQAGFNTVYIAPVMVWKCSQPFQRQVLVLATSYAVKQQTGQNSQEVERQKKRRVRRDLTVDVLHWWIGYVLKVNICFFIFQNFSEKNNHMMLI